MKRFFDNSVSSGITDTKARKSKYLIGFTCDFNEIELGAGDVLKAYTVKASRYVRMVLALPRRKGVSIPLRMSIGIPSNPTIIKTSNDIYFNGQGYFGSDFINHEEQNIIFTFTDDPTGSLIDFYISLEDTTIQGPKRLIERIP